MPFTLKDLKKDLQHVGSNFAGAPDLEFAWLPERAAAPPPALAPSPA